MAFTVLLCFGLLLAGILCDLTLLVAKDPSVQFDSPRIISIPHDNLAFCKSFAYEKPRKSKKSSKRKKNKKHLLKQTEEEKMSNKVFEACERITNAPFSPFIETVVCINNETQIDNLRQFPVRSSTVYTGNLTDNTVYLDAYYEWDEKTLKKFADYWFILDRKPTYKIIVARYLEDIAWLEPLQEHLIVLNKGIPLNMTNEIALPNVGREAHSYLWYIIHHYEELPEVLIFTQGDISDHHCGTNDIEYASCLESLRLFASRMGKATPRVVYKYDPEVEITMSDVSADGDVRILSTSYWDPKFNSYDHFINLIKNVTYRPEIIDLKAYTFDDWFVHHIEDPYPNPIQIYPNSLFSVHRRRIWRHPKSYYESLINEVSYSIHPIEAHFIERSWFYIF